MTDSEQFAQVAQKEWAIVRELLRLLTKNEQMRKSLTFWTNLSFAHFLSESLICSLFEQIAHFSLYWANRSFAQLFGKNDWFTPKFDDRIPNPEKLKIKSNSKINFLGQKLFSPFFKNKKYYKF